MNNSSDKKGRKIASYIIPGIITLLVMVFVLIVKGIWPFGSNRIDLFDNMQQVARCMHIYGTLCTVMQVCGLTGIQDLELM